MDYDKLLDLASETGYRLSVCGAETFRVEESVERILKAYGMQPEVFAIPSCLHVGIRTDRGRLLSVMRRIDEHSTDLDGVERYSALSRCICQVKPSMQEAASMLEETERSRRHFGPRMRYLGFFLASSGFSILLGGTLLDGICGGLCGMVAGASDAMLKRLHVNQFFRTIMAAFLLALPPYFISLYFFCNPELAIIGALMPLVPGLLFTNAMRDITYGDVNSAITRLLQVLLLAVAIAVGTAAAWNAVNWLGDIQMWESNNATIYWVRIISCFVACTGFALMFNIHGTEIFICAVGGVVTWMIYSLMQTYVKNLGACFLAAVFAAAYSEVMARTRKVPAISFLVLALVPLIPGAGIYRTMNHAVNGDMMGFLSKGIQTVCEAGIMAIGVICINTVTRLWITLKHLAKTKTTI